ncbi:VOC family protein [Sphaerotilus sp.]|uniref:VOC family protein n=1 Tax=Sphaerotilus sp. TaxID=2093942 RepID=UPI002ACE23BC|nr:VOC family protein [Sphaerotilus sp.]MDZ7856398.1 VOC family protein [Sphaerotilus sp.]
MTQTLAATALLVPDYDEAIAFFTTVLRWTLVEDTPLAPGKRWVLVAPSGGGTLLLARAANETQRAAIGQQGGGRVFLFLHTTSFDADHHRLLAHGVRFLETPRHEPYGTVAVFLDPWGNRWDLIQPS